MKQNKQTQQKTRQTLPNNNNNNHLLAQNGHGGMMLISTGRQGEEDPWGLLASSVNLGEHQVLYQKTKWGASNTEIDLWPTHMLWEHTLAPIFTFV